MSLILISSPRFAEHVTPFGHPESPERAEVMDAVAARWRASGGEVVAPPEVTREQLARVHDADYLRRVDESRGQAIAFDPDTYTSPETVDVARLAAGAAVDAVERVLGGSHACALALVRPPGHHAERRRAMGFCLYNNVAVAAAHARASGVRRAAIVDFDVHHGNGTQHVFDGEPDVLYVSMHQWPFYPGTGAATEVGHGGGVGRTVNVPLEAGAGDGDYQLVFQKIVRPVIGQFGPDLILGSAGFDAHERDPLANMRVTTPAFAAIAAELREAAEESCGGRLVLVSEGGYDLSALADSLNAVVDVLGGEAAPPQWPGTSGEEARRGREAGDGARRALGPYWRL
jgi:acetoin utilization deacetylase AcuC-like enzyme